MIIEIDQKPAPEYTADYIQLTNDKPEPYDEYALKCQFCSKNMKLENNIHTNVLLFQNYECKCPYTNTHIIVKDKRIGHT